MRKKIISFLLIFITCISNVIAETCINLDKGRKCIIFFSHTTTIGDLNRSDSSNNNGLAAADKFCNDEAGDASKHSQAVKDLYDSGITFKALMATNNSTVMGRVYYQEYRNETDERVQIAVASSGDLAHYLDNQIAPSWIKPNSYEFWFGGYKTSTEYNYKNTCDFWTDQSHGNTTFHGVMANAGKSGTTWLTNSIHNCTDQYSLVCVAQ